MNKTLQLLNIIGFVLTITVNSLANALPINGYTTGELSAFYPNLFTPAGITFSIWGLIYLALLAFTIFQSKGLFSKKSPPSAVSLIGLWFFISCLANSAWIIAWHYQLIGLSVIIMLILLFSLITIYRNLGIGLRKVGTFEKYAVHAPFSVYLGWISVATIANITAWLVSFNWAAWQMPAPFWAALMIFVATMLALFLLHNFLDVFFAGVVIWAFLGILYKQLIIAPDPFPVIVTTAVGCIFILLFRYFKLRKAGETQRAYL